MNTKDTFLLRYLLNQITNEIVASKARPGVLKQGTQDYTLLAKKLEQWQKVLGGVNREINANKSMLNLRSKKVQSLAADSRYSERQSIKDNSQNINQLESQIKKIEKALEELVFNVTVPTDFEVFVNALEQIKALNDWNHKLINLSEMCKATHNPQAQVLIREAVKMHQVQQSSQGRASSTIFPVQSMLLIVIVIMMLFKKEIK